MAIDFEVEEKSRRWMYILPMVLLALALCAALWGYLARGSALRKLQVEYGMMTKDLEKYRKLYTESSSSISGSEQLAGQAKDGLEECQRANIELQDRMNALELSIEAGQASQ